MSEKTSGRKPNRLIHETSPYLLQHAHNTVDWYPWGEDSLRRSAEEKRPILLSIGYSACHWCHVMERECFEDERIAALMNEHFVCVKVDREERPDLDDIYMAATQALKSGQGGWPMTVFLTPEQEPFFAGTYFPPVDAHGRPGFPTLLTRIADLWQSRPERLRKQAAELTADLAAQTRATPPLPVGANEISEAAAQLAQTFDPEHGGFGGAPKFPPSSSLSLLLRHHRRTGDENALRMVSKTLDGMARGGIHDHVGGGFARYATDERWLVPHFEKMLYDNALLARVYLEAWQATGEALFRRVATDVFDYVLREMTSPEGGFYSSTDADSEGEEGKFFVWTPEEVEAALGPEEGRRLCAYDDITPAGKWEGKSIANAPRPLEEVALTLGLPPAELDASIAAGREKLYQARAARVAPGLDDKILTAWNGLMIGAMAFGAWVLGEPRYLEGARRAADFILGKLRGPEGRLLRTCREGKAHLDGVLEDYAYLMGALIDLYEAGGGDRYLDAAEDLAGRVLAEFEDPESGGLFATGVHHEKLILRRREAMDGATPSPNAAAAAALARLSFHLDRPELRASAERALAAHGKLIGRFPRAFCASLAVIDLLLEGAVELAFVGATGDAALEALRAEAARPYLPNRITAWKDPAAGESSRALLRGKTLQGGRPALYVCRNFACEAPVTEPASVSAALAGSAEAGRKGEAVRVGKALAGHAVPEVTRAAAARFPDADPGGYAELGTTGLRVSRVGFGGYRVDDDTPAHREALVHALRRGCNLIDTSTNYTDGASERLVGEVLSDLSASGTVRREGVVVVSKIGYVQGANLAQAQAREQEGRPYPEMVKYADGVWHCIHPEFIRDQLTRSLGRLGIETLDVCLLHNPEYFLSDAKKEFRGLPEDVREAFYRRIEDAFAALEEEVKAGRIRWYGVSSNTLAGPVEEIESVALGRILAAARRAGGEDHHCRVVQFPMNLLESNPALLRKEGEDGQRTLLEAAADAGLGVLVNRPLNAMGPESMLRLATVFSTEAAPEGAPDFEAACRQTGLLEEEFRGTLAPTIDLGKDGPRPDQLFRWADQMRSILPQIRGLDQWQQYQSHAIVPTIRQLNRVLDQGLQGAAGETWRGWRERYLPVLEALLAAATEIAATRSRDAARAVEEAIDPLIPPERRTETLSRKGIWALASTGGVACVLTGMRRPEYVDDALAVMAWPLLPEPARLYTALRGGAGLSGR